MSTHRDLDKRNRYTIGVTVTVLDQNNWSKKNEQNLLGGVVGTGGTEGKQDMNVY